MKYIIALIFSIYVSSKDLGDGLFVNLSSLAYFLKHMPGETIAKLVGGMLPIILIWLGAEWLIKRFRSRKSSHTNVTFEQPTPINEVIQLGKYESTDQTTHPNVQKNSTTFTQYAPWTISVGCILALLFNILLKTDLNNSIQSIENTSLNILENPFSPASPKIDAEQTVQQQSGLNGWTKIDLRKLYGGAGIQGIDIYIHYPTIKKYGSYRLVWMLHNYDTAVQFDKVDLPYFSQKIRKVYDCTLKRHVIFRIDDYSNKLGSGKLVKSNYYPESNWRLELSTDDFDELLLQEACK